MESRGGHRFFLTIVDDNTRITWVTLLKHKSDANSALEKFINLAATQFRKTVKIIRSDNALEFSDHYCKRKYNEKGIIH